MDELIPTKVAPPIWMGDQIRRDSLLERLDEALHRRLTLIHAPAGYGKTSLLAQWRQRFDPSRLLVAWLTLERDDADPKRLAQYIALALSGDELVDQADRMPTNLPPRAALSAIINRIAREPRQVALILDDLHSAESPEVIDFLQSLIRLAPRNCHFIIASRDYPWLGQSVLAAEEQLLEITSHDLKFSVPEAEAMLARSERGTLGSDDVRGLVERTEGWPIALQLTFLSLKRGMDHRRFVGGFTGSSVELARYLSEQVLMSLPVETQDIIMRTALLDRITGEAVNVLCDREDGWLLLERLEQQGVLLTPLSPEREAYRYHQLFAEHLRERLSRQDAAGYRLLHRRLAAWYAGRGEIAEAVSHAIQADDDLLLAEIVEAAGGWRLIPQGHQGLVERTLAKLPPTLVGGRPLLVLARVYLDLKCGRMTAARVDYDRLLQTAAADTSPDLRTEVQVVGDVIAEYENVPMTLEDLLAREALLRTLPADDHLVFANVSESLGAKYYEGGWLERALEPTLAAREHYQALGSLYSDLFTRFHEARIRSAQGRLKDAAAILASARIEIEMNFGERSDLAANCAAFEAELLHEQDHAGDATALLAWALPHMEQSDGWVDVYAVAYFTVARITAAGGGLDEARALLARARGVATRRRLRQLELLSSLCELDLILQHDSVDAARCFAGEIGLDALADTMAEESPVYRPVATAAALCRAKLALLEGEHDAALRELTPMKRWASQHGAGRLLIDLNLLISCAYRERGDSTKAQAAFDEAVGTAMFQGIVGPFMAARHFVQPSLDAALASAPRIDRFRAQFLKSVARVLAGARAPVQPSGFLSDAEAGILAHLSQGYSNKEIARLIGMSPDTVKYRLKSVFRKVGVTTRRDAVRVSHERGLIGVNAVIAEYAEHAAPELP